MGVVGRAHDDVVPVHRTLIGPQAALHFSERETSETDATVDETVLQSLRPELSAAEEPVDRDLGCEADGPMQPVPDRPGEVVEEQGKQERRPARERDQHVSPPAPNRGNQREHGDPANDDLPIDRNRSTSAKHEDRSGDVRHHEDPPDPRPEVLVEAE